MNGRDWEEVGKSVVWVERVVVEGGDGVVLRSEKVRVEGGE